MSINFKSLLKVSPPWLRINAVEDIILASSARMVRNIQGHSFPGWSSAEERAEVAKKILPALRSHPRFRYCHRAEMSELSRDERCLLLERKQISPGMSARQDGCHLLITRDQNIFAMVNEEEHLCVHIAAAGFELSSVLDTVADISGHLESKLPIARNAADGYLTSMPQESGDGLELFVLLHLPALSVSNSMGKVQNAVDKLHLNITSLLSETEDCGNIYVLHTRAIPYRAAGLAAEHLAHVCVSLATKEERMQRLLFEEERDLLSVDQVNRAYGILRHACSLDYREMVHALSLIRLGLLTRDFFPQSQDMIASLSDVLELYELGPAFLRYKNPSLNDAREVQSLRSEMVRRVMKTIIPIPSY